MRGSRGNSYRNGFGDIVPDWVRGPREGFDPSSQPLRPLHDVAPGPEGGPGPTGGHDVAVGPVVDQVGPPEQPPVVDGFTMNAALRYLPYRYFPLALASMAKLRSSAGNWRCRHLMIPLDATVVIPFNQALKYTEQAVVGSYIYGYSFAAINGNLTDYRVEVTLKGDDMCPRQPLFSNPVNAAGITPTGIAGGDVYPVLIEPVLIESPGLIDVRIANMQTGVDGLAQLLLAVAEPCYVITDVGGGVEMER